MATIAVKKAKEDELVRAVLDCAPLRFTGLVHAMGVWHGYAFCRRQRQVEAGLDDAIKKQKKCSLANEQHYQIMMAATRAGFVLMPPVCAANEAAANVLWDFKEGLKAADPDADPVYRPMSLGRQRLGQRHPS